MSVPGASGLRLNLGEAGARRRIWDANQDLAGRTLNLTAGELRFALQRLVAVRAIEFEFVCVHKCLPSLYHAQNARKKYMKDLGIIRFANHPVAATPAWFVNGHTAAQQRCPARLDDSVCQPDGPDRSINTFCPPNTHVRLNERIQISHAIPHKPRGSAVSSRFPIDRC